MLRNQRCSFFEESALNVSASERLFESMYEECTMYFENTDVYMEGAGEVISKGFEKLGKFIQSIIDKIKEFVRSFGKNKDAKIDTSYEVDKKEVSKIKKFLDTAAKIIAMPIKKLSQFVGSHKKTSAAIALVLAFSVGALVTKKKNDNIRNTNERIRAANAKSKSNAEKYNEKKSINKMLSQTYEMNNSDLKDIENNTNEQIRELEGLLKKSDNILKCLDDGVTKARQSRKPESIVKKREKGYNKEKKKNDELRKNVDSLKQSNVSNYMLRKNNSRAKGVVDDWLAKNNHDTKAKHMDEIPEICNFYTKLASQISKVVTAIQQALLKLKH